MSIGRSFLTLLAFWGVCSVSTVSAVEDDAILGFWITQGGDARVEVFKRGTQYFAKIVGLREPVYMPGEEKGMDGKARMDLKNRDRMLRNRPMLGLEIMGGFEFGDGKWTGGRIYDPMDGKTYRCKLSLETDGTLKVRGYVGVSWLGRTSVWEPAEDYFRKVLVMMGKDISV